MEYSKLPGVEKPVARLVQGTVMLTGENRSHNRALFDHLFEQGFTTFDTAHGYNQGNSEKELGAWIKDRGIRDQAVILTKGAHPYPPEEPRRVAPKFIRSDIEESLERLQTDYIDLYVLHRDDPEMPVSEIVDVLNEQKTLGRIGAFGGSNWTLERIQAANAYAETNQLTPFAISSPQFSVAEMIKEPWPNCVSVSGEQGEEARQWYAENDVSLFTWSSLAGGFMTGKFTRDNLDSFTEYWDVTPIHAYAYESNFQRLDRVKTLAQARNTTPAQISLAYVLSHGQSIHAIVAAWEIDQVADNLSALDIKLTQQEIDWLDMKTDESPI